MMIRGHDRRDVLDDLQSLVNDLDEIHQNIQIPLVKGRENVI